MSNAAGGETSEIVTAALIVIGDEILSVRTKDKNIGYIADHLTAIGIQLKEVRIVDLQEGTFYADLIFDRDIKVSARPSDSVAIALRVGVPIYVEEAVLAEAGLLIPDENDEEATGAVREDEVEKFKEFLDSVSPDDFKAT